MHTHIRILSRMFFILSLLISYSKVDASAVGILIGNIEFPSLKEIPMMRLWFEGQIVKTEVHDNKISYRIPTSRYQEYFFLLFIEEIPQYILKEKTDDIPEQNTTNYFIVPEGVAYRIFELHRKGASWTVTERLLPANRRIPDSTIIVECPASHIAKVTGGNRFQLPSIIIKDNIVALAGSEEKLQESAIELLLASLDCDALHVPMKEHIKIAGNHILIKPAA